MSASDFAPDTGPRLGALLRANRGALERSFVYGLSDWGKYDQLTAGAAADDAQRSHDFGFYADYLCLLLETGESIWRDLLVGEKIRQAYHTGPDSTLERQFTRRRHILKRELTDMQDWLGNSATEGMLRLLEAEYATLEQILTTETSRTVSLLLVGDCVYLDTTSFLIGAALRDGITLAPTLVMSHNPMECRNEIRALAERRFDLVFYSPFTYEFSSDYSRLQWWHQGALPAIRIRGIAESAASAAWVTADLLCRLFEAPIYIHNSAQFRRHDGSLAERVKNVLSWRARRLGSCIVNERMNAGLAERRSAGIEQLQLLDETELVRQYGENRSGRLFYDHDARHPATFGRILSDRYREIVFVQAWLATRKVVVCDLDNTLWDGVIGEGAVHQFHDRQAILLRLKARGVVLAINSKNDPRNVHWRGASLSAEDFVSSLINWGSKADNLRRIAQHLNLKTKDFVFIDDRMDERALVNGALPEVLTLDATDPFAWRALEAWSQRLVTSDHTDRTQMYRERDARENFLNSVVVTQEDPATLYATLGLEVSIRKCVGQDVKRVVELVSRTNQFNTGVSRTTSREVKTWVQSPDHLVMAVDCADRFGSMGTVCVAVVCLQGDALDLPVFVLSCRVFGYGIEHVVVGVAKNIALGKGKPIRCRIVESVHNEPCRRVYADNGFELMDGIWFWGPGAEPDLPSWLTVRIDEGCRLLMGPGGALTSTT